MRAALPGAAAICLVACGATAFDARDRRALEDAATPSQAPDGARDATWDDAGSDGRGDDANSDASGGDEGAASPDDDAPSSAQTPPEGDAPDAAVAVVAPSATQGPAVDASIDVDSPSTQKDAGTVDAGTATLRFTFEPLDPFGAEQLLGLQIFAGPSSVQFLARSSSAYGASLSSCIERVEDGCVWFLCNELFTEEDFADPGAIWVTMPGNRFDVDPAAPLLLQNPTTTPYDWPAFFDPGEVAEWHVDGSLLPPFSVELPLPEVSLFEVPTAVDSSAEFSFRWSGGSHWVRLYVYSYEDDRALSCRYRTGDEAATVSAEALAFVTSERSVPMRFYLANESLAWATSGAWTVSLGHALLASEGDLE